MPVITRSQRKNVIGAKPVNTEAIIHLSPLQELISTRDSFIHKTKKLLEECHQTTCKENKMKIALEIYQTINRDLTKVLQYDGVSRWIKFMCTTFNKIIDFEKECRDGGWHEINEHLVETFIQELNLAKQFLVNTIKNHKEIGMPDVVLQTKAKISSLEAQRPRRNIKRVNYTYMDIDEPFDEYDGITDIWADLTIREDPDYEFEEDEDDEEDDEEDEKDDEM